MSGNVIGHGMEADVELVSAQAVERVESSYPVMPFDDADLLVIVGQSDAGGKTGHSGTDD